MTIATNRRARPHTNEGTPMTGPFFAIDAATLAWEERFSDAIGRCDLPQGTLQRPGHRHARSPRAATRPA